MEKKYELTDIKKGVCGVTLHKIKALKDFGNVLKGAEGGWIEKEDNLSQEGDAWVYGNAKVYGDARISFGRCEFDISKNLIRYIACSLNVYPINQKYTLYKKVNKIKEGKYKSCYDNSFIYQDGEIVEAIAPDEDTTKSCASGLHVSTPFYWNEGDTLIAVEVAVEDIITCQGGKLRVRKLKVLGEVKEF